MAVRLRFQSTHPFSLFLSPFLSALSSFFFIASILIILSISLSLLLFSLCSLSLLSQLLFIKITDCKDFLRDAFESICEKFQTIYLYHNYSEISSFMNIHRSAHHYSIVQADMTYISRKVVLSARELSSSESASFASIVHARMPYAF